MFEIKIKTGGAAFDESGYEVTRILKEIIIKMENGHTKGVIMDINGNKVGNWEYDYEMGAE